MTDLYFDIDNTCKHCGETISALSIIKIFPGKTHETILFKCGAKIMIIYPEYEPYNAVVIHEEKCKNIEQLNELTLEEIKKHYSKEIYDEIIKLLQ